MTFLSSLRAQRSNPSRSGLPRRTVVLLAMTILISACDAKTPQATQSSCRFTWNMYVKNMEKAAQSEAFDKIYYTQLGGMNIDVLLAKGCCKYADTCPSAVLDYSDTPY